MNLDIHRSCGILFGRFRTLVSHGSCPEEGVRWPGWQIRLLVVTPSVGEAAVEMTGEAFRGRPDQGGRFVFLVSPLPA